MSFTTPSIVNKAADCLTLSNVSDDCKRFGNIKSIQINTILELNLRVSEQNSNYDFNDLFLKTD